MDEDPTSLWRLTDPAQTRVRQFGDEALVFNPLSWETHLVNLSVIRVVEALTQGRKSEAELGAMLADEEDGTVDAEDARNELRGVLDQLESLGLAFRVSRAL
jgi:PqqD family protein of HPr-rel-A system